MADEKLVKIRIVNRSYPRDGVVYPPGEIIEVAEHVAKSMEEASPPYGERVKATPAARTPAT